jgi:nucleotide-binding universal stress UspA family protein
MSNEGQDGTTSIDSGSAGSDGAAGSEPRIVVGVDRSEPAVAAMRWAKAEAELRGAELDLVHAWSWPVPLVSSELAMISLPSPPLDDMRTAALQVIAEVSAEAFGHDAEGPAVIAHAAEGNAADLLLSTSVGSEMIVVGSKGHNALYSALIGSVSRQVAHHADVPVVIVRPSEGESSGDGGSGDGDELRPILVGVDGSDQSLAALAWAGREAELHGRPLTVVTTWDYPAIQVASMTLGNVLPPAGLMEEAAADSLRIWLDDVEIPASVQVTATAVEGSPAQAIIEAAASAHMLVIGARGSGGFASLRMGSVANRVIAHSPCPVVVVPAPHEPIDRGPDGV